MLIRQKFVPKYKPDMIGLPHNYGQHIWQAISDERIITSRDRDYGRNVVDIAYRRVSYEGKVLQDWTTTREFEYLLPHDLKRVMRMMEELPLPDPPAAYAHLRKVGA